MIYASRRINTDPEPYVAWGVRYPTPRGTAYLEPRPEYEVENNANPILVKFRTNRSHPIDYWVHRINKGDLPDGVTTAAPEHVEHALRVLTRLAKLRSTTKEHSA